MVSRYDDVLADVLKRQGYKAGDTLKLILPFLKAYDVTERKMQIFASKTLVLISKIRESLKFIRNTANAYIVSTSYEPYIRALCHTVNFPFKNAFCTKVKIDSYELNKDEKFRLRRLAAEIAEMPIIEIPPGAKTLEDFSETHRQTIMRLDEIFWKEIMEMDIGRIFMEVNPVGGREKAEAVKRITEMLGVGLTDVVYVGDSITDVEAFKKVRHEGGLTLSFNGNEYAVREAEIAIMSDKALVTALLTEIFCKWGKEGVVKLAESWNFNSVKKLKVDPKLKSMFFYAYRERFPLVEVVKPDNMERLIRESTSFRKSVRGEAVGRLG
ncbi:MAG: HAD hydrolase family protein [Candidatus Bathyarchaeia archaeon]